MTVDGMVTDSDRLAAAVKLAHALDRDPGIHVEQFLAGEGLPRHAHAWPELQTVIHAARTRRPVLAENRDKPHRRSRSIFETDVDFSEHGAAPHDDSDGLDVAAYSYAEIGVARSARTAYPGKELELRILSACAVRHGGYRSGRAGSHIVTYKDHSFIITEDGETIIGYRRRDPRSRTDRLVADDSTADGHSRERDNVGPRFDVANFDRDNVSFLASVLNTFANKHGTDHEEAEEELREFLAWALDKGKVRVARNGCGVVEYRGYTLWISPNGQTVTKYLTSHIERTPGDVRNGVPSRFGRPRERGTESTSPPRPI